MVNQAEKFIDIDKIFQTRNPGLYKWMPGFAMRYIKRILHQDNLNNYQERAKDNFEFDYLESSLKEIGIKITYEGLEHIPQHKSVIICANHPLGGADGMAIMKVVGQVRKDIVFIVNDLLSNLKNFGTLFFGVNKLDNTITQQLKSIDDLYSKQNAVLIFPAGVVSRKFDGKIQDLEWSKSFVSKAIKYDKDIIPIYVDGSLSPFFYRLYQFRKFLGIKAKIEMFYLVDEMFAQKGKTVHLKIGPPIRAELLKTKYNAKEWCTIIRSYVYSLAEQSQDFEAFLASKD